MKRALVYSAFLAVLIIIGCRQPTPLPPPNPPSPQPQASGCGCTITALGSTLVDLMNWTNPVTGHSGSGASTITPEFGSTCNIFTDPSINCSTNAPNVALVSFKCHGTNMNYAVAIILPVNCNGVQGTVWGDCGTCVFGATFTNGFWCNVYRPNK